ncbi:MAG: hypothetical protein HQK94_12140 [Nitrospirae bacterium]|nr:hypothetical protein [Nitrospirota bacterium]MBF0535908.1 hypothetical protein [Nitrospirota bacterium]
MYDKKVCRKMTQAVKVKKCRDRKVETATGLLDTSVELRHTRLVSYLDLEG